VDDQVVAAGLADGAPAERAGIATGDVIVAVGGRGVSSLAEFYRSVWALGEAGVTVPLTIYHEGDLTEVAIESSDRQRFLKAPRLH
jgi:S1-C subfamily serine protease